MFFPVKIKLQNPPVALVLLFLVLVPVMWLVAPIFTISAINTLFGTEIPLNLWTWLAAFWLQLIVMYRGSNHG